MNAATAPALLDAAVRSRPERPYLTFYDDATGERVELSFATFANWVAKTANLLDEEGVGPGDTVGVLLPTHWQAAVVMQAAWRVGAVVSDDAAGTGVAFCSLDTLEEARGASSRPIVLSLLPMGRPLPEHGPDIVDYATVLSQPDSPPPIPMPTAGDAATRLGEVSWTHDELVHAAEQRATTMRTSGARVLTAGRPTDADGVLDILAVPVLTGGSVVLCRHPDPTVLDRRTSTERVQVSLWAA